VSVKIPGSALAFRSKGSKAATELDFIGQFRDSRGRVASVVRDTIPLKLDQTTAEQVGHRQIQYDAGFALGPGNYTLRFVARETGEGKVGTFETRVSIPDLASGSALRLSSVVLSNQHEPVKKPSSDNPLIDASGQKLVPNVTRVFRPGQNLFVYVELYDPAAPEDAPQNVRLASVAASVSLYLGDQKILESQPVRANRLSP